MNNLNKFLRETETLVDDIQSLKISFNCKLIIDGYGPLDLNEPISPTAFNEIHGLAHSSGFGAQQERRFDETVRKSAEIKHPALRFEKANRTTIFNEEIVKLYKMVLYKPGDFFDWHLDTQEDYLRSTLMVNFGEYEGGELSFKDMDGEEFVPYTKNAEGYNACMFPIDLPHRANELTSGYKISLLFKVYTLVPEMAVLKVSQPLRKSPAETGATVEELMGKVAVDGDDVIWCSDLELVKKFIKVHPGCKSTEVVATSKPQRGVTVYPPKDYERIINDCESEFTPRNERPDIKSVLKECEYKTVTKCIEDHVQSEVDFFRYCYGWRGNSPVPHSKKVTKYNGFVIEPKQAASKKNPTAGPKPGGSGGKRGKKSVRGKVAKAKQVRKKQWVIVPNRKV